MVEVLFGFLSGFKSQVFMPFVIAGVCHYLRTGKLNKKWIALAIAGIFIAYAVIEPFRAERDKERYAIDTSIADIADTLFRGVRKSTKDEMDSTEVVLNVAARSNLSYIGSFGIEFADDHPVLRGVARSFSTIFSMAPLHSWIPRFIWKSKSLSTLGVWYCQVVMRLEHLLLYSDGAVYLFIFCRWFYRDRYRVLYYWGSTASDSFLV